MYYCTTSYYLTSSGFYMRLFVCFQYMLRSGSADRPGFHRGGEAMYPQGSVTESPGAGMYGRGYPGHHQMYPGSSALHTPYMQQSPITMQPYGGSSGNISAGTQHQQQQYKQQMQQQQQYQLHQQQQQQAMQHGYHHQQLNPQQQHQMQQQQHQQFHQQQQQFYQQQQQQQQYSQQHQQFNQQQFSQQQQQQYHPQPYSFLQHSHSAPGSPARGVQSPPRVMSPPRVQSPPPGLARIASPPPLSPSLSRLSSLSSPPPHTASSPAASFFAR